MTGPDLGVDSGGEAAPAELVSGAPPPRRRRFRLSIQSKLLIMLLATSIISALVVGVVAYRSGTNALRHSAFERLTEVRESRSREISRQFEQMQDSLVIYTRGSTAIDALEAFKEGFHELEDASLDGDQEAALEAYYENVFVAALNRNLGTTSEVEGFLPTSPAQRYVQAWYTAPYDDFDAALPVDDAGDGSAWSAAHARYHDYFREIITRFDFEDALLIDADGEVVYTAYKGVDLGTNLVDGPFSTSALAVAFHEALASNAIDYVGLTDFERYQPSFGVPSGWALSPIGENGRITGVLALQIPIAAINDVMTGGGDWQADGLGETGETYLVGRDLLMRSVSRLVLEDPEAYREQAIDGGVPPDVAERAARVGDTILIQTVDNEQVRLALRGEIGELVGRDYLGHEVLTAYEPVHFEGLPWVVVAELDTSEAFEPVDDFARNLAIATAAIIFGVCLASLLLAQVFARPLRRLVTGVRHVAAGDLDAQVAVRSNDEFGDLSMAFNDMSRSLSTKQALIDEQQSENQRLLLSMMPENVARRYRQGEETISEDHRDVAVVFADVAGFDDFAAGMASAESLALLNGLVRTFDEAAERIGVERVRTLRTGYLASSGLIVPRVDNVRRAVDFAREMHDIIRRFNAQHGASLALRAGVDAGTVTSGLVGRSSVVYDMWGDAVNLAYRVQGASGQAGIFVTGRVYDRLREMMKFVEAGQVETQSGTQPVWLLQMDGA